MNVTGLILVTNEFMIANASYAEPQLISRASTTTGDLLRKFIFQQTHGDVSIVVEHNFIERCYLLTDVIPNYFIMSLIWLGILIAYWLHTFVFRKQYSLYLQRFLLMIPLIKIFETFINGLFLTKCPWLSAQDAEEKYIDMARISIITFTYTALLALLYLLSQGWNTISFQMTRDQATSCTMVMASTYLCYSAYFLSSDFQSISEFMKAVMAGLYLVYMVKNSRNLMICLKALGIIIT